MDAPKTIMKCDVRREGCAARIDGVDDDDEHEGLDGREAQEEDFGSTHTASSSTKRARVNGAPDDASSFDKTGVDIASRSRECKYNTS